MLKFIHTLLCLSLVCSAFAQRIITAGSALTETVCALGDCGKIIASDRTSLYPAEIQKLPSIGYRSGIHAEGIISLKPTLVIAEKDYVDQAVITHLESTGIKLLVVDRTYSAEGTRSMIRQVAEILGRKTEGEKLITKIEQELTEAKALVTKSGRTPRVLCVFNRDKSSMSVAGTNTFSAILPYVGAQPALSGVEGYKPLNTESLIASNADYLLMFEAGVKALGGVEGVLAVPGVMQITAGKKKQIIALNGTRLSNFGPRLGETVKELARILHTDIQP